MNGGDMVIRARTSSLQPPTRIVRYGSKTGAPFKPEYANEDRRRKKEEMW